MANKSVTAVEWLVQEIAEKYNFRFATYYGQEIQQAKEMEKEKEKSDWISGYLSCAMKDNNLPYGIEYLNLLADKEIEAEQYYNETFNTTHNQLEKVFGKIEKSEWQKAAEKRQLGRSTKTNWSD